MQDEIVNYLVLKDRTVIPLTQKQQNTLAYVYLATEDINNQMVKVGEHKFKLMDIMTEKEKAKFKLEQAKAKQQKFELDDKPSVEEREMG